MQDPDPSLRRMNHRTVHLQIQYLRVFESGRKDLAPLRYRGLGKDRGRRRHISPHPVRGVRTL